MSNPEPRRDDGIPTVRTGRHRCLVATLVVIVAFGLRVYRLGHENFWIDEVFQRDIAAQPLTRIVADYRPTREPAGILRDQAPLSHLLFHFFVGDGERGDEAWARLPSAVAGALGAGLFFLLAWRLVPAGTAVLATLLLVLSPLHLWYSQECRFYGLWTLEATASFYALVRALEGGRTGWWIAYTAASIAGLYTCLMHGMVIAAQCITMLWYGALAGRPRAIARAGAAALVAVGVATIPVALVVVAEHARGAGTPRPPSLSVLPYTLFAFAAGYSLGPTVDELHALPSPWTVLRAYPSVLVVGAVFGLATAAGIRRLAHAPRAASVFLPWLVVPPCGILMLSLTTQIVYNVRYALPSLGAYLVVVAAGCGTFARPALRRLSTAAVLTCTLIALAGFYWDSRYDKAQAREAMAHVGADGSPARVIMVGQLGRALEYYARGTGTTLVRDCDPALVSAASRAAEATSTPALWIAAGRDWSGAAPSCLAQLASSHRIAEHRRFVGVELWRLDPR